MSNTESLEQVLKNTLSMNGGKRRKSKASKKSKK